MRGLILSAFLAALLLSSASVSEATNLSPAMRLGPGINVLGYDPVWTDPRKAKFKNKYFVMIYDSGFRHVRINLFAFSHMDKQNHLDPQWLQTLDDMIAHARHAGLKVILDEHDYIYCQDNPASCREKLLAFWNQIALRYRDYDNDVLFEILNEPNRKLTLNKWNSLLIEAYQIIRNSNKQRVVVIGPGNSNNFRFLDRLKLPSGDDNIIVSIHYYDPMNFTYQGADWTNPSLKSKVGVVWGSKADRARVQADFDAISRWSKKYNRPIIIGEFGTYDKADIKSRAEWTNSVARISERHGFAWCYWQFQTTFGAFDPVAEAWRHAIYTALIPQSQSTLR